MTSPFGGVVPVTWEDPSTGEKIEVGEARIIADTEGVKTLIEVNGVGAKLMGLVSMEGVSIIQKEIN